MAKSNRNNFKDQNQLAEAQIAQFIDNSLTQEADLDNLKTQIEKTLGDLNSLKKLSSKKQIEITEFGEEQSEEIAGTKASLESLEKQMEEVADLIKNNQKTGSSNAKVKAEAYKKELLKIIEEQKKARKEAVSTAAEIATKKKAVDKKLNERFSAAVKSFIGSYDGFNENLTIECTQEALNDTLEILEEYKVLIKQKIDNKKLINEQDRQKEVEELQRLREEKNYVPIFSFEPNFNSSLNNELLENAADKDEFLGNHQKFHIALGKLKGLPESHTEESNLQSRLNGLIASKNSLAESLIKIKSQKTISEAELVEKIRENQENIAKTQKLLIKKENEIKRLNKTIESSQKHLNDLKSVKEFAEEQANQTSQSSSTQLAERIIDQFQNNKISLEKNTRNFLADIKVKKFTCQNFIKELAHYIDGQNKKNDERKNKNKNLKKSLKTERVFLEVHNKTIQEETQKKYEELDDSLNDSISKNKIAKDFLESNQNQFKNETLTLNPTDAQREQLSLKIQALESLDTTLDQKIIETRDAITELNQLKNIEKNDYRAKLDRKAEIIRFQEEAEYDDQPQYLKSSSLASAADGLQSGSETLGKAYFQKDSPKETLKNLEETKTKIDQTIEKFKVVAKRFDEGKIKRQEEIQKIKDSISESEKASKNDCFKKEILSNHRDQITKISKLAEESYQKLTADYQEKLKNSTSIAIAKKVHKEYAAQNQLEAEKLTREIKKIPIESEDDEQKNIGLNLNTAIANAINNLTNHSAKFGLYELHSELQNYIKNIKIKEPTAVTQKLRETLEKLEEKTAKEENDDCIAIENSLKEIPTVAKLLDDSTQSLSTIGKARDRVTAKITTLNAINNRIGHEMERAKKAQEELKQYKDQIELKYTPKVSVNLDVKLPKKTSASTTEEEKTAEISNQALEKKLAEKGLSLDYLYSPNKLAYEKKLLIAKKATEKFLKESSLDNAEKLLAEKIGEKEEQLPGLETLLKHKKGMIEKDEFAIKVINNHLETVKKHEQNHKSSYDGENYKEKLDATNEKIRTAPNKEAADRAREEVHRQSSENIKQFLKNNKKETSENLNLKKSVDGENAEIFQLKSLSNEFLLFRELSKLVTQQPLANKGKQTGINEYELTLEFKHYIKELQEKLEKLNSTKSENEQKVKRYSQEIEKLKREIAATSFEHWDNFQRSINTNSALAGFLVNNKDKIQTVIEEESVAEHRASASAIEIFDKQLAEALAKLELDPELELLKNSDQYVYSGKTKRKLPKTNFEKWMHQVFKECEWKLYSTEERRRNATPNPKNINFKEEGNGRFSFSYGSTSIILTENEHGGHTITTNGFDRLDPERGNVIALIYTHLLEMHHKQIDYFHFILGNKGKISPEGKKRGFYLYREEDDKVWALVIHDDQTSERLCLTDIDENNLLESLDWPENNQKNSVEFENRLNILIMSNCKQKLQQGGINWANAKKQNFFLDKPKLTELEMDEVLRIGLGENVLETNLFKTIPGFENVETVEQFREKVNFISEAEKPEPRAKNTRKNTKNLGNYHQPALIKKIIENDSVDEYKSSDCRFSLVKNQIATYILKEEFHYFPVKILEHVIRNEQADIKTFLLKFLSREDNVAKNLAETISNSEPVVKALLNKELLIPMIIELIQKDKLEVAEKLTQGLKHIDKNSHSDLTSLIKVTKAAQLKFNLAIKNNQAESQTYCANIIANCYKSGNNWSQKEIAKKTMSLRNHFRTDTLPPLIRAVLKPVFEKVPALKSTQRTKKYKLFNELDESKVLDENHAKFLRQQKEKLQKPAKRHNKESPTGKKVDHGRSSSFGSFSIFGKTRTPMPTHSGVEHNNSTHKR